MATERGSLGFGQRLVLLGGWLVSCGFVYVLGFYVGKGMHDGGPINPGVSLPVDAAVPPAPPADAQAPLTFYDVLGTQQGAPPAARPAQQEPAARPAAPDTPAAPRPTQPGAMSEQKPAATAPVEATPPAAATPGATPPVVAKASVPTTPPAKPATTATTPTARPAPMPASPAIDAGVPPLDAVKPPVAAKPAAPVVASAPPPAVPTAQAPPVRAAPAAPAVPPPAATGLPPQTASGRWTVYANPSRDQLAVEYERAALRAKGYPAEVVTMKRDGDTWYRIRVGRYATEAQAEQASRKLRTDGVGHAFVQSE